MNLYTDKYSMFYIGTLKLTPDYGNQLGGAPIIVSGPNVTFKEEDDITCVFGGREAKGVYVNEEQALCVSPELSETGIVLFQLLIAREGFKPFCGEANFKSRKSLISSMHVMSTCVLCLYSALSESV